MLYDCTGSGKSNMAVFELRYKYFHFGGRHVGVVFESLVTCRQGIGLTTMLIIVIFHCMLIAVNLSCGSKAGALISIPSNRKDLGCIQLSNTSDTSDLKILMKGENPATVMLDVKHIKNNLTA